VQYYVSFSIKIETLAGKLGFDFVHGVKSWIITPRIASYG
jgi:hypothetical protein